MKGYIVIVEEQRSCDNEASVYASTACHTNIDAAVAEMKDEIENAKNDECSTYGWLAVALDDHQSDVKEKWFGERYVQFRDTLADDCLNIYIHEANVD